MDLLFTFFVGLSVTVPVLWIVLLLRYGLVSNYRSLNAYLAITAAWTFAALILQHANWHIFGANAYRWFFILTRPVIWALFFFVVFECYSHMMRRYPGVRRAGELVLYGAVGSMLGLIALVAITDPYQGSEPIYWHRVWLIHEQSVYFAATGCVAVLALIQRFFSLSIPPNVRVVFGVFGLYFSGMAALIVARSFWGPQLGVLLDAGGMALYVGCLAYGAWKFSPAGETAEEDARLAFSQEERQHSLELAMRQLEHVNVQLMRVLAK